LITPNNGADRGSSVRVEPDPREIGATLFQILMI
jgi:hypothetical protein